MSGQCDDQDCEVCRDIYGPHLTFTADHGVAYYAAECPYCTIKDIRISELEVENERLKCCGHCAHNGGSYISECEEYGAENRRVVDWYERCHFAPSRWAEGITT